MKFRRLFTLEPKGAILTEAERDQMAHAIGHHSAKGCSVHGGRNHYVTSTDDLLWSGLVDRGLATRRSLSFLGENESTFHVTDDGIAAIEADPRSTRSPETGRAFVVQFKGSGHSVHVRAETHGKARYAAVVGILDVWPDGALQAFRSIESCKLANTDHAFEPFMVAS